MLTESETESRPMPTFQKGDIVVTDNGMTPQGGLAEFMVIPESQAVLKPKSVTTTQAAASSSAITPATRSDGDGTSPNCTIPWRRRSKPPRPGDGVIYLQRRRKRKGTKLGIAARDK